MTTSFDRFCSRLWVVLAIGGGILALALFTAGAATAAVPAEVWSDARQTSEIKKLKAQNRAQGLRIQALEMNLEWHTDLYERHLPALLNCVEMPDAEEQACIAASFPGVVR